MMKTGTPAGAGERTSTAMHEGRDGGESGSGNESGNGSENGDENRAEGRERREAGDLRSGNRGRTEDNTRRATLTSSQQPQPQALTPQRDRRIMLKTRAQGRRRGTASGRVEKRRRSARNPRGVVDAMLDTRENWAEREEM